MAFPSDRFAAFLAHRLNAGDGDVVDLHVGQLYDDITGALARQYAAPLLTHALFAWRMDVEEVAQRYFAAVLDRGFWLVGAAEVTVAHRLYLALVRRGIGPGWSQAAYARLAETELRDSGAEAAGPLASLTRRLARLPQAIDQGNPAASRRAREGALVLRIGNLAIVVPEQISIWGSAEAAPLRLAKLPSGEAFNAFCAILIDALRTAHRPYQEFLALGNGLCPFDWMDVLGVNQVRGLRRFLEALAAHGPDGRGSIVAWRAAWETAPVPGIDDADALWRTEIGHALRSGPPRASDVDLDLLPAQDPEPATLLDRTQSLRHFDMLLGHGVIGAVERDLLVRLFDGESLAELGRAPEIRSLLNERRVSLSKLLGDLQERIVAATRELERRQEGRSR